MNRIQSLFENKVQPVLSVYFTAGHPEAGSSAAIIRHLQEAGADMIEIGIPFSDPLADGPTIQQSSEVALRNGMNLGLLFEELANIRKDIHIPLVFMGYLNPILQFGMEKFCERCAQTGIDGVIVPDLPLDEYVHKYKDMYTAHGLEFICLITPQTPEARIREIDKQTGGFMYMVAAASTTGAKSDITREQVSYFERIANMKLRHPRLIGFGISNKATYDEAAKHADGVIIGSAFIKAIEKSHDLENDIHTFVRSIRPVHAVQKNH